MQYSNGFSALAVVALLFSATAGADDHGGGRNWSSHGHGQDGRHGGGGRDHGGGGDWNHGGNGHGNGNGQHWGDHSNNWNGRNWNGNNWNGGRNGYGYYPRGRWVAPPGHRYYYAPYYPRYYSGYAPAYYYGPPAYPAYPYYAYPPPYSHHPSVSGQILIQIPFWF